MVAQAADIVHGLGTDPFAERVVGGIHRTGEDEVLPDENARPVARLVKGIVLVEPAAPDAQHVEMRIRAFVHQMPVIRRIGARQKTVRRDQVGPLGEHRTAVDLEVEALAPAVGLADHPHTPQPQRLPLCVVAHAGTLKPHLDIIQMRITHAVGPPQLGPIDSEGEFHRVGLHRTAGHFAPSTRTDSSASGSASEAIATRAVTRARSSSRLSQSSCTSAMRASSHARSQTGRQMPHVTNRGPQSQPKWLGTLRL